MRKSTFFLLYKVFQVYKTDKLIGFEYKMQNVNEYEKLI